jgi:hypothetical protein
MKEDELGGICSMYGNMRNPYKISSGKSKRRIHWEIGRLKRRWNNIRNEC